APHAQGGEDDRRSGATDIDRRRRRGGSDRPASATGTARAGDVGRLKGTAEGHGRRRRRRTQRTPNSCAARKYHRHSMELPPSPPSTSDPSAPSSRAMGRTAPAGIAPDAAPAESDLPLAGLRVVELHAIGPVPFAGMV